MSLSHIYLKIAGGGILALLLGLVDTGAARAQSGPMPTRGYELQEYMRGRSTRSAPSVSRPVTAIPPAPPVARSGPSITPPVTLPTAPAVTGDATARPAEMQAAPVIIWYEYVPRLGGWVEFRGYLVTSPPTIRR